MDFLQSVLTNPITLLSIVIGSAVVLSGVAFAVLSPKQFMLVIKNLRRNVLRTVLTSLTTMVLVFMITLIWSVIFFIDSVTQEKSKDFKLIVTERWQLPSQLPPTHADYLNPESPKFILDPKDIGPNDFMTWSFYGGFITKDKAEQSREKIVFFFAMNPKHIRTMMDNLQDLDPELVRKLEENPKGCLLGYDRAASINRKVGERFTVYSMNYKDIDLEFEVVGLLPRGGQYDQSGIMNDKYFNEAINKYERDHQGQKHPLDNKRLNLIWLRVRDQETFNRVGSIIETSPYLVNPPVKCETASSGIGSFLEAYRIPLFALKWFVVPAILFTMSLVVANAISISVRERRGEMAVLKVLGFRPNQIFRMVLGESLLVGSVSGFLAAFGTYFLIDVLAGGIKFPIAFFPAFMIPGPAIFWGLAIGSTTAFLGSFIPSFGARSVKVSEVFSKVT